MIPISEIAKGLEGASPYDVLTAYGEALMIPLLLIVVIPSLAFILFGYLLGVQRRENFWALWLLNTIVLALAVFIIMPLIIYWM